MLDGFGVGGALQLMLCRFGQEDLEPTATGTVPRDGDCFWHDRVRPTVDTDPASDAA
jgi:hypothetical protein